MVIVEGKTLIDAHVHLDSYSDEIDSVLEEIFKHRILTISNSMDIPSYERNLEIGNACDFVIPTFGVHPWNAHKYADQLKNLDPYIEQSPMIGEIGLDYYFDKDPAHYPAQRNVFKHFLQAARGQDKIVNLHTKGAERDVLNLLKQYEIRRAIVHWYSGPMDVLYEFVDFGAYFTIGVELAFSDHIKAIAETVPMDRLLTETDNPGGIKWLSGKPGMPLAISDVVRELANVKNTTPETIIKTVDSNLVRLIERECWMPDRLFPQGHIRSENLI